jgi:hypothetical protein
MAWREESSIEMAKISAKIENEISQWRRNNGINQRRGSGNSEMAKMAARKRK